MKTKLSEVPAHIEIISGPISKLKDSGSSIDNENYVAKQELPNHSKLKKIDVDENNIVSYDGKPVAIPMKSSEW